MKFFERTPIWYDRAIRWITFGKMADIRRSARSYFHPGQLVLDLGCGTGEWSLLAASQGAHVKAIDTSPLMLQRACSKACAASYGKHIHFAEQSLMELDNEPDKQYDVVITSLVLSECRKDEQAYALPHIARVLKPGGLWILVDEITPQDGVLALCIRCFRNTVLFFLRWMGVAVTHPLRICPADLEKLGFRIKHWQRLNAGTFLFCVAQKEAQ
jgi:ubiquinone/menaquinone biosynthesis C-methylase UbiE